MPITHLALVVHSGKPAARVAANVVRTWANAHGLSCADIDVWDHEERGSAAAEAAKAGNPDLVVTIGGDGTFLRGARIANPIGALVLGVNLGRLGFLTDIPADGIVAALDAVHTGRHEVDGRMTLTMRASRALEIPAGLETLLRYGRGPSLPPPAVREGAAEVVGWGVALDVMALNDVVFEKLARDRQANVAVYVSGRMFASYSADALIVGTATGSTAYSFAAGGPILSPHLDALVFTPVAPHMTFNRSLVLSMEERVGILVLERSGQVAVSVDGQLRGVLDPGDWATVYAGPRRTKLVRLAAPDFLGRVRDRFGLADSAAALADGASPAVYRPSEPLPDDLAHPGPRDEEG